MKGSVFRGDGRDHQYKDKRKKLKERFYKSMVFIGLGISYRGLKGWMKSKKKKR